MTPKVSVVVPVYNVEKYFDKCVRSLIDQTLKEIEIILVDDGSTDKSGEMCDIWAQKDDRIRVVHKQNGGLSDARNVGVSVALADYVGFVDSDDYVEPTMFELLYRNACEDHAEISICGVYSCYANQTVAPEDKGHFVLTAEEAIRDMLSGNRVRVWVPVKLYLRSILLAVPFPQGRIYEDAFVSVELILKAKRISLDLSPQYYYCHHEGTITSENFSKKSMDIVDAYEHCYQVVRKHHLNADEEARFRLYWSRFVVLDKMLLDTRKVEFPEQEEVVKYLRDNWKDIFQCRFIGKGRKIAMAALMLNVGFYKQFARINAKRYAIN